MNSNWNIRSIPIEERRIILGLRLKSARLKAMAQRKLSRKSVGSTQSVVAKKHQPMTQAFAAKQLGISQSFLSKLEKGQQEPNFLLVEKMAAYYDIKKLSSFGTYSSEERKGLHHLNDH
jgi:transcriptional regulator with XRE-family HTH domain